MSMADVLLGIAVAAGVYFALKFIRGTKHCDHNCSECRHPCRIR